MSEIIKLTLNELVKAFEKGAKLSSHCLNKLNNAKIKIEKLIDTKKNLNLKK